MSPPAPNRKLRIVGSLVAGCGLNLAVLSTPLIAAALTGNLRESSLCVAVVFLTLATLLCGGEALATTSARQLSTTPGDAPLMRLAVLNGVALLVLFLCGICLRAFGGDAGLAAVELFGIAAFCIGCLLRFSAMQALGQWFRTEGVAPEQHSLQTRGVFAVVRHPSEVGLVLIVVGASLLLDARLVFVAVPVQLAITLQRVALEDRLLEVAHGSEHRSYVARVASLIPLIY